MIIIFKYIDEVKILLDNDNIFVKNDNEEYISFNKEQIDSIINYIVNNVNKVDSIIENEIEKRKIFISFISRNIFDEKYFNDILQLITTIYQSNHNLYIKLYVDSNNYGNLTQYKLLKNIGANIRLIILTNPLSNLIQKEFINEIITYFPMSIIKIYINNNNYNFYDIWNHYKDFNLKGMELEIEENCIYSDEIILNIDEQLSKIDEYFINSLNNYNVPLIFENYKYFMWKFGVKEFFKENNLYRNIPEGMNGNRCGMGCNKQLTINYNGDIYTCPKILNLKDENNSNLFAIGNIDDGLDLEKIENLISLYFDEENTHNLNSNPKLRLKCSDCKIDSVCTKGCITKNYIKNKILLCPSESYCKISQLFFEHIEKIINYYDTYQNNELFKDFYLGCIITGEKYVC